MKCQLMQSLQEQEENIRYKSCPYSPCRLPRLLMMATDTQADLTIGFESTTWCHEAERRRPEWVCGWKNYATMIDAVAVD